MRRTALQTILWTALAGTTTAAGGGNTSVIFFDNTEWLSNYSNLLQMSWSNIQAAFVKPNHTDSAASPGRN